MPASKAQQAKTRERRINAIQLYLSGADWEQIARRLGYASRGAAFTDVNRALEEQVVELSSALEVLRKVEAARLDRLQSAIWVQALGGDLRAVETALRISDRRALLLGLNRPSQVEVVTYDAIDQEIRRLQLELGQVAPPATGDDAEAAEELADQLS